MAVSDHVLQEGRNILGPGDLEKHCFLRLIFLPIKMGRLATKQCQGGKELAVGRVVQAEGRVKCKGLEAGIRLFSPTPVLGHSTSSLGSWWKVAEQAGRSEAHLLLDPMRQVWGGHCGQACKTRRGLGLG